MRSVNIHDAKTHFSRFVDAAAEGESIVIAKAGKPVARLVPLASEPERPKGLIGFLRGRVRVPDDFNRWAEGEIAAQFMGGE
jgi:prevent-host-death family protein